MSENSSVTQQLSQLIPSSMMEQVSGSTVDILAIIRRHLGMIFFCATVGILLATIYWAQAKPWYESSAKIMVSLKDMRSTSKGGEAGWGSDRIQDEILDNHLEIVSSRRIIGNALNRVNWKELEGLKDQDFTQETDEVDYVKKKLRLTKGGTGSAKKARTLSIAFRHTDANEAYYILASLMNEYELFLDDQVTEVMSKANHMIKEAEDKIEAELKVLEQKYIESRQNAPVLFTGDGERNVFMDSYRRLQDELLDIDIKRSAIETRNTNVLESLKRIQLEKGDTLEMLSLIDNESLQRLGTFAGFSTAGTAEFQQSQVQRIQGTQTRFNKISSLKAELARLESSFAPNHPEVELKRRELRDIEKLLADGEIENSYKPLFESLTPEVLLRAYTGFLKNDLAVFHDQKLALEKKAMEAETMSKSLVEFELKDRMLQGEISRKQSLYEGIVSQLREMDTAAGLSGYVHEVLEDPQMGQKVWPSLPLCAAGGMLFGICMGVLLAVSSDQLDNRFRSPSEIDQTLGVPVIAQVGKISHSRDSRRAGRFIVDAQAPEAEAFRLMRTYLLREVKTGNLRTAMITSSQPKDGKSTILANLGASFAELGLKVLIIDGDMRAPTVHRFMDIPIGQGLSEFLQQKAELKDVLRETGIEGFSVMTAGGAVRNPAELLQGERFDHLLDLCKKEFSMVLVDSGPVLLVSDPAIVSQKCDITLLVIRPSVDTKKKVTEAVRRLRASKSNLRGCILNTYGSSKEFMTDGGYSASYYGYGYGYGNRGYGRKTKEEAPASENSHRSNGASQTKVES